MHFTSKNYQLSGTFALSIILIMIFHASSFAQLMAFDDNLNKGITVSPTNLKFNVEQGFTQTQKITVSNATNTQQKLNIVYQDFDISKDGESRFLKAGSSESSISELIEYHPKTIEIEPNTSTQIEITVKIPDNQLSEKSAWGVLMIENADDNSIVNELDNVPTFALGVWLYQSPDDVEDMHVDITNLIFENKVKNNTLFLKVKNKGDGISFCNAYVEITNLSTGETSQLGGNSYSILPGNRRTFVFDLAENLPKGSYSAVGVVDYQSEDEIVATELQFTIDK